jgi:hypothetical protein
MDTFGEPRRDGGGPRLLGVAMAVALAVVGLAIVFVARRPEKEPGPRSAGARPSPSPRPTPSTAPAEAPSARPRPEAEALGAAATSLRVDSDVPGASIFLDRRFLGTSPLATSDVLHATTAGLRFEASKAQDSFDAAFASLEPLHVVFLKRVEAARARL